MKWSDPLSVLIPNKKSKTLFGLSEASIKTLEDLLYITPLRSEPIPLVAPLYSFKLGNVIHIKAKVLKVESKKNEKSTKKIALNQVIMTLKDEYSSSMIEARFFNLYPSQVEKLRAFENLILVGTLEYFANRLQTVNPLLFTKESELPRYLVTYPTLNKIKGERLEELIAKIPNELWDNFPPLMKALKADEAFNVLHLKSTAMRTEEAKEILVRYELILEQLKLKIRKLKRDSLTAPAIKKADPYEFCSLLPYKLTEDQESVLLEIANDFKRPIPSERLIQGDVGSGKTIVAILAALMMIKEGYQVAFMAPTESLAFQHQNTFLKLNFGITSTLLLGSMKTKEKKKIQKEIVDGEVSLIFGTHALFQNDVIYKNLGLVIIDEQHKFGVNQRILLTQKSELRPHTIMTTATPIPRSLALTQLGDLSESTIRSVPSSKAGHKTKIVTKETYPKFLSFLKTRLTLGEQAYIVFPAVHEDNALDLLAVEKAEKRFLELFPEYVVKAIHGEQKSDEKLQRLTEFSLNKIQILIATSVIEVGIDVHNATLLAVYHPERFGLASLHQLRGRVGRGSKAGFFFLIESENSSDEGKKRLQVLENSSDGFFIAEEDLKMRGCGDITGLLQSGDRPYFFANPLLHQDELLKAKEFVDDLEISNPQKLHELIDLITSESAYLAI